MRKQAEKDSYKQEDREEVLQQSKESTADQSFLDCIKQEEIRFRKKDRRSSEINLATFLACFLDLDLN